MNGKPHADDSEPSEARREPSTVVETTPTMHKDKIAQIEDRLGAQADRADLQGALLTAQDLQLTQLQRRVDALYEAMQVQNQLNANNDLIGTTLRDMVEQLHRELAGHDERIQAWSERWRGVSERIERTQGTLSDLLKRFEAWKVTGNELRQQVDDHHKAINIHTTMFDRQIETNESHSNYLGEIRAMLDELLDVVRGKPENEQEAGDEGGSDQGRHADGGEGPAGQAVGAGDGADPAAQGGVPGGEHRHDEPVLSQAPGDDKG